MSVRQTKINWAGATWNPISGCSQVSEGCQNCYAMKMAGRMIKGKYAGLVRQRGKGLGATWPGGIRLEADALNTPLTWRQPTKIFVNSMSDLFHEDVPDAWIDQIVGVMQATPQHIYQILTKRADRLPLYTPPGGTWPTNVWLGVSIESDKHLDRIDHLRKTDAAVKWVSAEPLIAPLIGLDVTAIDWMVVGGESGAGHRKMELAWVRDIMTACKAGGVPVWVKQLGTSLGFELTGSRNKCNFEQYNHVWPEDVRVQEWPLSDQKLDTDGLADPDAAADVVASRKAVTTVNGDPTMRSLVPLAHRHDMRFLGELLKL